MSTKYFVVSQILPSDFFVLPTTPGVDSPSKTLFNTIRAKADEMITAGKMAKGTLGTRELPNVPGGSSQYVAPGTTRIDPNMTNVAWDDRIKPWATNLDNGITTVDYPHQRVVPEPFKSLRVLKGREAAQEWCDFMMSLGAERMDILTDEELIALGRQLPDDSDIDQHMEA